MSTTERDAVPMMSLYYILYIHVTFAESKPECVASDGSDVVEGATVNLTCQVCLVGRSRPSFKWNIPSSILYVSSSFTPASSSSPDGMYICFKTLMTYRVTMELQYNQLECVVAFTRGNDSTAVIFHRTVTLSAIDPPNTFVGHTGRFVVQCK